MEHEPAFISGFSLNNDKNGAQPSECVKSRALTGRGQADRRTVRHRRLPQRGGRRSERSVRPGDIAQAHTCDEWLPLAELPQATEVLYEFCRSWS